MKYKTVGPDQNGRMYKIAIKEEEKTQSDPVMRKIHVSELEGSLLDYAVAMAIGYPTYIECGNWFTGTGQGDGFEFSPSSDWAQCGPLIDEYDVQICGSSHAGYLIYATKKNVCKDNRRGATGFDLKQTICRTVLAAKLGDEIEIPDELVKSI